MAARVPTFSRSLCLPPRGHFANWQLANNRVFQAKEDVLELVHPALVKRQGRVVGGTSEGCHHAMASFGKSEKTLSDFVTSHGDSLCEVD